MEAAFTYRTDLKWFKQFTTGDYDVSDAPHPGAATHMDLPQLHQLFTK